MAPLHINEEKEEKDSEDRSQRLHQAEAEGLAIKLSQHPQRLSDSENEEPVPDRIPHRSAFVSKSSANSLTSLAWGRQSKVERSQSCTDTTVNESITLGRRRAAHPPKAKVPLGGCLSSAVVGVLLSTENSRSFSAPVLTAEKRLSLNPLTSFVPLHKPDRSISPESNDSISEELNHFKPIVCSPCTPPKRLPDGRILSPVIIKSTPRNLRKSLQKPTTYEASPMILKKWEQVFQDRQMKKTLSKGTLTSSAEPDEDASSKNKQVPSSRELSACKNSRSGKRNTLLGDVELLPSSSKSVHLEMRDEGKNLVLSNNDSLVSTGPLTETGGATDFTDLNSNLRRGSKPIEADSKEPHSKCLRVKSLKTAIKRPHRISTQLVNMQNGACFRAAENISPQIPQRRGQKKRCKTKHLEQNGSFKRLKVTRGGKCVQGLDLRRKDTEQRLAQEEEDKKLALKLQQIFDKETRTVNRCKGSRDEYPLRSKSTAGAN
ncbi:E3 ubiquitin-protein ligase RNF169 isoform X2 [Xenopus laevis]|uniref:RING-type E3 ubiquitin transferase n=1 Tax=Xenopus laevis TaxID=8355 RepID=A0A8J0UBN8_XENLA|nr:E3 ubiquitin-protein ligase RNF169 isoform X2 [Xenopus laevis]